jgi:adenosylhomocysteine nucleosidase
MSVGRRIGVVSVAVLVFVLPGTALAQSVVGVLGIKDEVAPIEKRLQDTREVVVRGYVFRLGTLDGRQVVVGRSGAGKVNAAIVTTLLIDHFNPSALFFSGTAGAVDPSLYPGDVVIGAIVAQHDYGLQAPQGVTRLGPRNAVTGERDPVLVPAPEALLAAARRSAPRMTLPRIKTTDGDRVPRIVEGVIVTGDVFLSDLARREELRRSLGATAIEMEGAAVVQTCRQFRVSCLVVRSVTDRADTQAQSNYEQFLATASENAAAVVSAIIATLEGKGP